MKSIVVAGYRGAATPSPGLDFKWLRALIREWSPGWNFSEKDFGPLKAALSDSERLSAALAYYRAMPRKLAERATWALLHTPIKAPPRVIRGAHDGSIGPEMFEGQEKFFAAGFDLITLQGAGHLRVAGWVCALGA